MILLWGAALGIRTARERETGMVRRTNRSNSRPTPQTPGRESITKGASERVVPQPVATNQRRPPGVRPSDNRRRTNDSQNSDTN